MTITDKLASVFMGIGLLVGIFSCALTDDPATVPLCRHTAMYCALAYGDINGVPTRIVCGTVKSGERHAQAQARVDGEWVWLQYWDRTVIIGVSELDQVETWCWPWDYAERMYER